MNGDRRYRSVAETMRRHIYDIPLQRTCETLVCLDQIPLAIIEQLLWKEAEIAAVCTDRGEIKLGIAAAIEAIDNGYGTIEGSTLKITFDGETSIEAECNEYQIMVLMAVKRRRDQRNHNRQAPQGSPAA